MPIRLSVDFRFVFLVLGMMFLSLVVISGITGEIGDPFFTPQVMSQLKWFGLGWIGFFGFAYFDYRKLKGSAWIAYIALVIALIGLFFAPSVHSVHRWYRLGAGFDIQPSELSKLIVGLVLAVFIDHYRSGIGRLGPTLGACIIGFVPTVLVLRQPDLGTAMILGLIVCSALYVGGAHRMIMRLMVASLIGTFACVALVFSGAIPHESLRPYALRVMKEYQYERLVPGGYHQKAAQIAIGTGGVRGKGWRQADYTGGQWLPAAHTDSAFAAFAEQFGLAGIIVLLVWLFSLFYLGLKIAAVARDLFGKILAATITTGLGGHILVNMGMMSGLLPITGVPLALITYGGSSVLTTMMGLGLLQSIYSRRF